MPEKISKAGVLGGGLMGGGIAFVTATKANIPVRVKDINHKGIGQALKYSYQVLNKKVKRRFMLNSEMQKPHTVFCRHRAISGCNSSNDNNLEQESNLYCQNYFTI